MSCNCNNNYSGIGLAGMGAKEMQKIIKEEFTTERPKMSETLLTKLVKFETKPDAYLDSIEGHVTSILERAIPRICVDGTKSAIEDAYNKNRYILWGAGALLVGGGLYMLNRKPKGKK